MVSLKELSLPAGAQFGSYFWITHDKKGNRRPEYRSIVQRERRDPS